MRRVALLVTLAVCACGEAQPEAPSGGGGGQGGTGGAGGSLVGPEPLEGTWSDLPPLLAPRTSFAAVAVDRRIHIVGGFVGNSATASDSVAVYDVDAPGELPLATLPNPAAGASVFAIDGDLLISGGIEGLVGDVITPHDSCHRLELSTQAWSSCANVGNGPTSHMAWTTAGEQGYLFGGLRLIDLTSGSFPTKVVQRYEAGVDAWHAETTLPEFRDGAAVIMAQDVAHVIGGRTIDPLNGNILFPGQVLSYDLGSYAWASDRITPMAGGRAGVSCAERRGFVYCFGGYDASGSALDLVERLELSTGVWTSESPLPQPLRGLRAVALDNAIIVMGGHDASDAPVAAVYRFE